MPPLARSFMNARGLLLGCLVLTAAHIGALAPPAQTAHPHPEPTARVKKHHPSHARKPAKAVTSPHSEKKQAAPRQAEVNQDVVRAIRVAQRKTKADPAVLMGIAWQESRFDPLARNRQS